MAERIYDGLTVMLGRVPEAQAVILRLDTLQGDTLLISMSGEGIGVLRQQIDALLERHPEVREWKTRQRT